MYDTTPWLLSPTSSTRVCSLETKKLPDVVLYVW